MFGWHIGLTKSLQSTSSELVTIDEKPEAHGVMPYRSSLLRRANFDLLLRALRFLCFISATATQGDGKLLHKYKEEVLDV